jgi:vitamin-K-epoxide reductase (warfarin-sensitive)
MKSASRLLVLVFLLLGLSVSSYALYVHGRLIAAPSYVSPCDINATVSCSHVYMSRFGSVGGVPMALLGVIWFVFVALLTGGGFLGPPPLRNNFPGYLFALSTVGLAVILYLAYAAFFVLKTVCVLCLMTYVSVIGLFLVSGIATSFRLTRPRRMVTDMRALVSSPVAVVLAVVFIAGAATAIAFFPRAARPGSTPITEPKPPDQQGGDLRSELERFMATAPRAIVPVSSDGAAVLIVKFSDYQCPGCAGTYFAYKPILAKYQAEYPGAVKLVTKDLPWNSECNPLLARTMNGHEASCDASVAVALARRQGRDGQMEDWLFTNSGVLTPLNVRQAARTVGQVTDWDAAYPRALEQVKSDASLGSLLHVSVTPTFFINGVMFPGAFATPALFDAAIAVELKRLGKVQK